MSVPSTNQRPYPGEVATVEQVYRLAEQYRAAAQFLLQLRRRGDPLSLAPCRLAAIHAIELYLNVLLVHVGHDPRHVRGMQHDLAARTKVAIERGLQLRRRTAEHLAAMTSNREYLVSRYGPEVNSKVSEINRLIATMDEVAGKVAAATGRKSI